MEQTVIKSEQSVKWMVYVDDNFNFMREDERWLYGTFDTYEDAVSACKAIVDACLPDDSSKSADELMSEYGSFGDDPFIVGPPAEPKFSAWEYARLRCKEIAERKAT